MIKSELWLPIIVAFLLGAGLLSLSTAAPTEEFRRQIAFMALAGVACAVVLWLGRSRILRYSFHLYALSIFLLILTQLFGTEVNGAQSWLYLGPLPGFQPSELAKIALILALATILHERPIRGFLSYLRPVMLIGLPFLLVFLEPDLGSALVIAALGAGVMLVRGIPWWHLLLFGLLLLVAVPTVVWPNLTDNQKSRIFTFLDPEGNAQGSGYQVIQAQIAIGSGGLLGKGYGQGTQSQLGFIPYHHTDFIYPVIAEEGGFVAATSLLLLYGLLFCRLVAMAAECPYERDQFVIAGVLILIGFQVIVNIGVTLGLAPVTGITLPLISYGGTSLLSTMIALAIAYVVHRDRYQDW